MPGGLLFGDPQAGVLPLHVCVPQVTGHQTASPGSSFSLAAAQVCAKLAQAQGTWGFRIVEVGRVMDGLVPEPSH